MKAHNLIFVLLLMGCATTTPHRTERPLPEGKVKFCFVGDMGKGNEAQLKVAQSLEKENCHSIHFLGDLVYPNGIKDINDPLLEDHFLKYYRGIKAPISLILGNHDHRANPAAWKDLPKKDPHYIFPNNYYLQNWAGLCLVHLDTNYYKLLKDLFRAQAQTNWLAHEQDYLKESCSITVALSHHPYLSRGPHHFNSRGVMKDFLERYIKGSFDYHIAGHEHILSDEGKRDGTQFLISGAGGNLTAGEDYGYLVMSVDVQSGKATSAKTEFRRFSK